MCKCASALILFVLNSIIALIGLAILIVGALATWNKQLIQDFVQKLNPQVSASIAKVVEESIIQYGLFIFIIGCFIFAISFCGCCGVWCKNRILLGIYASCIVIMALILIIGLIVLAAMRSKLPEVFTESLNKLSQDEKKNIETTFKCCGMANAKEEYGGNYPDSCCEKPPCNKDNIYSKTCNIIISDGLGSNKILIAAGVMCGIFIIIGAISIYLLKRYSQTEEI